MVEAERRADRDRPLPRLEYVGVADAQRRQPGRRDLEQGHVGLLVAAHDLGGELAAVGELDLDLVRAVDDVVVGKHVPIRPNDEDTALKTERAACRERGVEYG